MAHETPPSLEARAKRHGFLDDERKVFFYPAARCDWNPLYRCTHLADTFVYCDYKYPVAEFEEDIRQIHEATSVGGNLRCESIESLDDEIRPEDRRVDPSFLTPKEKRKYQETIEHWGIDTTGWGRLVHLTRRIGSKERSLKLYYFGGEGTATYLGLFVRLGIAPRIACIVNPGTGFGFNWTDFRKWDAPLGRAMQKNPAGLPELLICNDYGPGRRGPVTWPYPNPWQVFTGWQDGTAIAAVREEGPEPGAAPVELPEPGRQVVLVREALTEDNLGNADAVLVSQHFYQQNEWVQLLTDRKLIVMADPRATGIGAIGLPVAGRPLPEALARLSEVCEAEKIEHVASFQLGTEDEGEALLAWRAQEGWPRKATFYAPSPGDAYCYAPYVDEIV